MYVCGKNVLKETPINKIHKVFLREYFKDNDVINYLKENKIRFEFVSIQRLNKMVKENHQGIVIDIDDYEYYKLDDILEEKFVVCLLLCSLFMMFFLVWGGHLIVLV